MPEGGLVVRLNGERIARCYAFNIDYDKWEYVINNQKRRELPPDLRDVRIDVEREEE